MLPGLSPTRELVSRSTRWDWLLRAARKLSDTAVRVSDFALENAAMHQGDRSSELMNKDILEYIDGSDPDDIF